MITNYLFSDAMKMVWRLQSNDIISIINYINAQNKNATGQYYDLQEINLNYKQKNNNILVAI